MATPTQQQQQQPPRRLTIRELQERRARGQAAFEKMKELNAAYTINELLEHKDKALLQSVEATFTECLPFIREGALPKKDVSLALSLVAQNYTYTHRNQLAMPLLYEAASLVKPPASREEAEVLMHSSRLLGNALLNLGRLQEAEVALLDALDARRTTNAPDGLLMKPVPPIERVQLAELYLYEMGRTKEALEHALVAQRILWEEDWERIEKGKSLITNTTIILMDIYAGLRRTEEYNMCYDQICDLVVDRKWPTNVCTRVRLKMHVAEHSRQAGSDLEAKEDLETIVEDYRDLVTLSLASGFHVRLVTNAMRTLVKVKRRLGEVEEAGHIEADLDETEAILNSYNDAVLMELRAELQEERGAAATTVAAADGGGGGKKKLTRKQQKRKAKQKRNAEARAAAEAVAAAEGEEGKDEEVVEAASADQEQQHQEPEPQQPEPEEPEEEPEECAICLNDLPAAGVEGGAVLLQCSHTFHADCLARWKAKCLEKGLRFTCAICRGAVVVAPASGAET